MSQPKENPCPECDTEMTYQAHNGDFTAPDCSWWECEKCGFKTEPE